ncbi:hypothetical protein DFJ74DRAFT_767825 [Hyaloraphidium curvatum]|nr:hypothetical protein DFJ74DRAFT_767825 [Hyaloraphidium curvatum]
MEEVERWDSRRVSHGGALSNSPVAPKPPSDPLLEAHRTMEHRDAPAEPITGRVFRAAAARGPGVHVSPLLPDELLVKIAEFLSPASPALLDLGLASSGALAIALPLLLRTFSVWHFVRREIPLLETSAHVRAMFRNAFTDGGDRHYRPAVFSARRALDYIARARLQTLVRKLDADATPTRNLTTVCRRALAVLASSSLRELSFHVLSGEDLAVLSETDLSGLERLTLQVKPLPDSPVPTSSPWRSSMRNLRALRTLSLRGPMDGDMLSSLSDDAPHLEVVDLDASPGSRRGWPSVASRPSLAPLIRAFAGTADDYFALRASPMFSPDRVRLSSADSLDLLPADWSRLLPLDWSRAQLCVARLRSGQLALGWPDARALEADWVEAGGMPAEVRERFEARAPGWFTAGRANVLATQPDVADPTRAGELFAEGQMWERVLGMGAVRWMAARGGHLVQGGEAREMLTRAAANASDAGGREGEEGGVGAEHADVGLH